MTTVGPDFAPEFDSLPDPGTDEGWAALEREAQHNHFPDARSYLAAYEAGRINVGAAGYQPGNPHTGFGQLQAYDRAAGQAGESLHDFAEQHTPEALARARGEEPPGHHPDPGHDPDPGHHPGPPAGGEHPFSPPANFTSSGDPIEYDAAGNPQVPNYLVAKQLPAGVDHYDRYTGEPLDAAGHIVPGVRNAGEGHTFHSALDQRIGLDEHGRIDPDEVERLEAEARADGRETVSDHVAATTRPFPGHPLSDTGGFARPVVAPGQAPAVYSGPDGTYIVTSGGTVFTGGPGSELTYEGKDGSATVDALGRTVTTDPHGHTTVHEPIHDIDPGQIDPSPPAPAYVQHVWWNEDPNPRTVDLVDQDGHVTVVPEHRISEDTALDDHRPVPGLDDHLHPGTVGQVDHIPDDGLVNNPAVVPDDFGSGIGSAPDGGFGSGGHPTTVPEPRDGELSDRVGHVPASGSGHGQDDEPRHQDQDTQDQPSHHEDTSHQQDEGGHHGGDSGGHDSGGHDSGGHDSGGHEPAGMEHAG